MSRSHPPDPRPRASGGVLRDLAADARFAARSLARNPGFALLAVLTLAVGIGAGTAMFSVLNAVLLRDLPVRDAERVVVAWARAPSGAAEHIPLSQGELAALREGATSVEVAGMAFQGAPEQALRDGDEPVAAALTWVTGDFFPLLGVTPVLGRTLRPSDDVPGAEPVMVVGHGFWRRHFGGDPAVLGRTLEWSGRSFTVVGVLPQGFSLPHGADVWTSVHSAFPEEATREASGYVIHDVVGRLRPGATPVDAARELAAVMREGDAQRPPAFRGMEAAVTPLTELVTGDARPLLGAAAAAVALLLLIACINVANLLLIRGSARAQEMAVRSALGAGRWRLIRQLLTESGLLALGGAAVGVPLAYAAVRLVAALAPPEVPRRDMIAVDGAVLAAALAITAAAALLSGLLPAVLGSAGGLATRLRAGGRGASAGRGAQSLRHALVVGQVALAIVVVSAAGLLVRSLVLLQGVDLGFPEERLLVLQTSLSGDLAPDRARQLALREQMLERVSAIPGVEAAASLTTRPFPQSSGWMGSFAAEGQTADAEATNPLVDLESIGPEFFRTLGLPIRRGRAFTEQDREDAPRVAVVSESLARRVWQDQDPVGRRIKLGPSAGPGEWHTVVGVAADSRYRSLVDPQPLLYLPTTQFGPMPLGLAVRTRAEPESVIPQVRAALSEVHPQWLLVGGASVEQLRSAPLARPRFGASLLGAFAGVTLLLAAVGIYGALAAAVRHRTREMGIRLALGARAGDLRRLVLRQGMALAAGGCALGLGVALLATRVLRSLLFGVGPTDPPTLAAVVALILGAAALACWLPARRAARVDPGDVLRSE